MVDFVKIPTEVGQVGKVREFYTHCKLEKSKMKFTAHFVMDAHWSLAVTDVPGFFSLAS